VISALTTADPATTLRQVQNAAQAGPLELIPKYPIHGRHQRVRHALKLKSHAIDSELLGIEHVRLGNNGSAVISLGGSKRKSEFLAQTRRHGRQRNGRGGGPGLNERQFRGH
jgi:hypothetical protein